MSELVGRPSGAWACVQGTVGGGCGWAGGVIREQGGEGARAGHTLLFRKRGGAVEQGAGGLPAGRFPLADAGAVSLLRWQWTACAARSEVLGPRIWEGAGWSEPRVSVSSYFTPERLTASVCMNTVRVDVNKEAKASAVVRFPRLLRVHGNSSE